MLSLGDRAQPCHMHRMLNLRYQDSDQDPILTPREDKFGAAADAETVNVNSINEAAPPEQPEKKARINVKERLVSLVRIVTAVFITASITPDSAGCSARAHSCGNGFRG